MQYTQRKLQRSVIEIRSVSSGRFSLSRSGSTPTRYPSNRLLLGSFGPELRQLDDRRAREAHVFNANPLALAVGVVAAREDVRRRQAHLGQRRAVGAASDCRPLRLEADTAYCLLEVRNDLRVLLEPVAHVAVLSARVDLDRAA